MSKLLEAVFDEVEFRLAKRAIKRRAIKPQRVASRSIDQRPVQSLVKGDTVAIAAQSWPRSSVLIPRGLNDR